MRLTLHIGLALILVILVASPPGADAAFLDGLKRLTGNAWEGINGPTRAQVPDNLPHNPSTFHNLEVVGTAFPDADAPLRVRPTREEVDGRLPLNPGSHVFEQHVAPVENLRGESVEYDPTGTFLSLLWQPKGAESLFNVAEVYEKKIGLRVKDFAPYSRLSKKANERISALRLKWFEAYRDQDLRKLVIGRALAEEKLMSAIGSWTVGKEARVDMFKELGRLHALAMDSGEASGIHPGSEISLAMRSTELRTALELSAVVTFERGVDMETRWWYIQMAVEIIERERRKLNRMFDAARSAGVLSDENVFNFLRQRNEDLRESARYVQIHIENSKVFFDEADRLKLPRVKDWRSSFEQADSNDPQEETAKLLATYPQFRAKQE